MKNWDSRPEWSEDTRTPREFRIRQGNHGNGRPDRPSKLKRRAARAEAQLPTKTTRDDYEEAQADA